MMSLTLGNHNVLIRQERAVDVLTDTRMVIGVATAGGKVISVSGKADPKLIRLLTSRATTGMDGQHLYSSAAGNGLIAFAITERSAIQDRLDHELWLLVPLGLAGSAILISLIIWVSRQRLSLQGELQIAVKNREFVSYYQPIIELASGRCVGAEALVRWKRPGGAIVSPNLFIPLAEQVGLISDITDQLIQRVVADLAVMLALEPSVHIAINIAPTDIDSGRFLPVLRNELEKSGICAAQIWLEATERGFVNPDAARKTISEARAAGHKVAIDDFGTGYSSLSMLETLPLDALKIDKSFVDAIGKQAASSVITPHIIEMAHGLRLSIVAEGVESLEQEAYLRDAGVQFVQGYYYSKPLTAKEFIAFYTKRRSDNVVALRKEIA
jgi:sensor c-di-GMP phosphodiesterase-like protein